MYINYIIVYNTIIYFIVNNISNYTCIHFICDQLYKYIHNIAIRFYRTFRNITDLYVRRESQDDVNFREVAPIKTDFFRTQQLTPVGQQLGKNLRHPAAIRLRYRVRVRLRDERVLKKTHSVNRARIRLRRCLDKRSID